MANLAIFAGIRKNIREMEDNERNVLTDMLLKMDFYDLYGKLAIPKKHDFASEVPELYRLCADSGGGFVNAALVEPFGLTIIEASACGLPIIATNDGGPVDIVAKCASGILVDAASSRNIGAAIREMLVDHEKWRSYSRNGIKGVRSHYSWASHCQRTVDSMKSLLPRKFPQKPAPPAAGACRPSFGGRLTSLKKMLITDIDNTLVGDRKLLAELLDLLHANRERIGWGVATGRSLEMTLDIMSEQQVPIPDILICSVGTEIYYGPDLRMDKGWQQHLNHRWRPGEINRALAGLEFLSPQGADGQRPFKISYFMPDDKELLDCVIRTLRDARLRCRIIYSHGKFLDILPARAGKGKAISYLKNKWGIAPANVMVAGDSGNDEDMLLSRCSSLVVGNHSRELDHLQGKRGIFFSRHQYAGGIIDGLKHYKFL
jgi:sucrose-phosphate synthase